MKQPNRLGADIRLKDLDDFKRITIQCHDNLDSDAIALAYGFYRYFSSRQKDVSIIYSGSYSITVNDLSDKKGTI